MKKLLCIMLSICFLFVLSSCSAKNSDSTPTDATTDVQESDSDFVGTWLNADSSENEEVFQIKNDGSLIYEQKYQGTWTEENDTISIKVDVDGAIKEMSGYFIIACDGFVCRATVENQHYLDDNEGVLELEIMLTENTCIDCVKA